MSAAAVHDCSTAPTPAGWPPLQVLVLFAPPKPGATPALARAAAQGLAREVLRQRVVAAAAMHGLRLPPAARGAQCVSLSHAVGATLMAWCLRGAVGVDLVDLEGLALASQQELVATAALYLGPNGATSVAAAPHAGEARIRFALRWAGLEARLKCLGLELGEWQPALDSTLGGTDAVQVRVKDGTGQVSRRWIGCVAWRAGSPGTGPQSLRIMQRPKP